MRHRVTLAIGSNPLLKTRLPPPPPAVAFVRCVVSLTSFQLHIHPLFWGTLLGTGAQQCCNSKSLHCIILPRPGPSFFVVVQAERINLLKKAVEKYGNGKADKDLTPCVVVESGEKRPKTLAA